MSNNPPKIKFVAIARMSDTRILTTCGFDSSRPEQTFKNEAQLILNKLQDVYLKAGERQKIRTANGAWYNTCDTKDIFYLTLTDLAYPERHAYTMIEELIKELKKLNNYDSVSEDTIEDYIHAYLRNLIDQYNDIDSIDNLAAVQNKANQVKDVMADTIQKTLENKEAMQELDHKSENINMLARGFHDSSRDLANQMKKRNQRRMFIYAGIGIIFIIFLYLIIR